MSSTDESTIRVGADETVEHPRAATEEVVTATVPGESSDNYVTLTLAHPLTQRDRTRLGLPADASTEVGQKVRVNRNGAKAIITAGYATVDPEDKAAVRGALRGGSVKGGEPTAMPSAEAPAPPAPPAEAPRPRSKSGNTGGSKPSEDDDSK